MLILFFFGRTTVVNKKASIALTDSNSVKVFDIQQYIAAEKVKLSPERSIFVSKLENGITRGDVAGQQIKAYESLAAFWKDTLASFEPYAFYISEASKLENSEKKLTFAARLFSDNLRGEKDEVKLRWQTAQGIDLFERALKLNPENDDLRIGLGSCYIYGRGRTGNSQETMQGIRELLSVVRKDSTNMKAQLVLGVGGLVSGQYLKAVERLKKVVAAEPGNAEAVAYLADAYAGSGNKAEAIKWYTVSKRLINDPHYNTEVDERIKTLK